MLGAVDRVCPLLALGADRRTAVDGVDGGHRCHALDPPAPLERDRQARLCLTAAHQRCERYLAHVGRGASAVPGSFVIGDGIRSTRLLLAPEPAWRGMAGRARRSTRGVVAAGVVLGVAVAGATLVAASVASPRGLAAATATARPSSAPSASTPATARPTAGTTPGPTDGPASVTPGPSASPTPAPTPTPAPATAAPTPQRTYVVQDGDTLAAIAQRFGVSVSAIQAANGIEDPNEIIIGDVLVIP
jgi:LysM repeat protein